LVKSFLMKGNKNDIVGNDYYQDGYVNIYQTWSYSSKLPKEIRNKLDKMREVDKAKVSEVKQFFSNMTEAEISQFGAGAYEIMVFGNRMGNYINTSKYSNIYLPQSGEQVVECHCYDGGTLKELKLADIFIEGYNYKPVVMEAIRKAIKNYDGNYEGATGEQYSDQQYEDVYSQITGFNLAADTVEIPIIHPVKGNQTYGLSAYIPFKDFGCDNMIIFQ
jgi:hypothetical protein